MKVEKCKIGTDNTAALTALSDMMAEFDPGKSYADMMRYRIAGKASDVCNDVYYIAHEDGKCLSRLWMGWGKHKNAIGNWGNFFTDESCRGQGIGRKLLDLWYDDLKNHDDLPLGYFCTTGSKWVTEMYAQYGWRTVIPGREYGQLYLPINGSPETFGEFCDMYYTPADTLSKKPMSLEYRHEIDCLLRFYFTVNGLKFGFDGMGSAEEGYLYSPDRTALLFTPDGKCVGWMFDDQVQVHPKYSDCTIE